MFDIDLLYTKNDISPVFVVAEIGLNHNGNIDLAKQQIDGAIESGADAVKFQVFKTKNFYNKKLAPNAYKLFTSYELSYSEFEELKAYSLSKEILFFATPLDFESLDFLLAVDTPIIKVASSDITCEPFLHRIAESKTKTIVSTGFVAMDTIKQVDKIFNDKQCAFLYCVSKYPTNAKDLDLNFITKLRNKFEKLIGFSDHSKVNFFSFAAVGLGAKIIERHFTIDCNLDGADHQISLDKNDFAQLVEGIRHIEKALGNGKKNISQFEKSITSLSMRDMYAKHDIKKGSVIHQNDIALLRPGVGITINKYRSVVGKIAGKDIGKNERISGAD